MMDGYEWALEIKYSPDQPRVPAGQPGGGRWTSGGAGGGSYPVANPAGKDTFEQYRNADGTWTPERQALHEEILASFYEGKTPVDDPKSYMMGGGSASGKSTVLRKGLATVPDNAVLSNSDDIKAMLPEYGDKGAPFVHEESSYLSKRLAKEAAAKGYNVVMDGTGDSSVGSLERKIKSMSPGGREVHGIYVTVDTEVAVARSMARAKRSGRYVPESVIRGNHASVSAVFPEAVKRGFFTTLRLFDNNGKEPFLIAEGTGGKLTVHDQRAYERFLAKAGG